MHYPYRPELETSEVADGESVSSRMMMLDHAGRPRRVDISDTMRNYMRFASHRPGPVQDAAYAGNIPRSLRDAMAERARIFDQAAKRGDNKWREPLVSNSALVPPYDQRQSAYDPNGDDDDEENGADENGEFDLDKLMQAKEDAYQARNARGDSAYKNPPNPYGGNLSNYGGVLDPREADRVEAIRRQTVLR